MSRTADDMDRARDRRARILVAKAKGPKKSAPETVIDPEEALDGYDDKFLECRDLGHPW